MSKHTAEPWEVLEAEDDKNYLRIRGTVWGGRYKIANVVWPRHSTPAQKIEEKETIANATRIVVCVNACVGMDDPIDDIATLKRQRDELIDAVKLCANELEWMITEHNMQNMDDGVWLYDHQTPCDAMQLVSAIEGGAS